MIKQGFYFDTPLKATVYSVRPTSSGGLMVGPFNEEMQKGIDDIAAGRVVSAADVEDEMQSMHGR